MSAQFISFRLKEIPLKEDVQWYFINLDQARLITIRPHVIFFFDGQCYITVDKVDHPEAYEAIKHFFLTNQLDLDYRIIEESEDTK